MHLVRRLMSLVPNGFVVESDARVEDAIHLSVRARAGSAACPSCGMSSQRVHSRYVRKVTDLSCSGRAVHLRVVTRRFCCQAPTCPRRIFAERFDETDLVARSRRTTRLEGLVHHLGLALGGRPAAAFATRLMMPVSLSAPIDPRDIIEFASEPVLDADWSAPRRVDSVMLRI